MACPPDAEMTTRKNLLTWRPERVEKPLDFNMTIRVIIYWEDGDTTMDKVDSEGYNEYLEEMREKKKGVEILRTWIE